MPRFSSWVYWWSISFSRGIGALVAGFAAGYLLIGLRKLFAYLPDAFKELKLVLLYSFFGILIIAAVMIGGMVPHGDIFVIGVISNPPGYFIALIIGALVGISLLAILKKPLG